MRRLLEKVEQVILTFKVARDVFQLRDLVLGVAALSFHLTKGSDVLPAGMTLKQLIQFAVNGPPGCDFVFTVIYAWYRIATVCANSVFDKLALIMWAH